MKKINRDEVYVVNQPKHITSHVIVMGDDFPLYEDVHEKLGELGKAYDLLLIFSPDYYIAQKEIDFDRFSSLYESCAWIVSGGNMGATLFKLLEYSREIMHHRNILISDIDSFTGQANTVAYDRLERVIMSPIQNPILKIDRLDSNEMFYIYTCKGDTIFRKRDSENKYCSYRSKSDIMVFRDRTIDVILEFAKDNPEYMSTFVTQDIQLLLGSIIKRIGLDYLDMNYSDVQV